MQTQSTESTNEPMSQEAQELASMTPEEFTAWFLYGDFGVSLSEFELPKENQDLTQTQV